MKVKEKAEAANWGQHLADRHGGGVGVDDDIWCLPHFNRKHELLLTGSISSENKALSKLFLSVLHRMVM